MQKFHLKIVTGLLLLNFILLTMIPVVTANPEEVQENIDRTQIEIAEFENFIKEIEEEIENRTLRLEELTKELQQEQFNLTMEQDNLILAQDELRETLGLFSNRLRTAYMQGVASYLELFLKADSFADIIVWWVYLTRILENDGRVISELEHQQVMISQKRSEIEAQIVALDDMKERISIEQTNLNDQKAEKQALLADAQGRLRSELAELARLSPRAEVEAVYSVVLDNISSARPHHGISEANVVYEYEVEGGITRYLALFSSFPTKVGPIRSARIHSAVLALENNTSYIHAGGGVDVLQQMRNLGVRSINELAWSGGGFFRDTGRRAPHNLFVNLASLDVEQKSENIIMRPAFINRQGSSVTKVDLEFNNRHTVSYTYNPEKESFRKSINGERQRDARGQQIYARNIMVARVPYGIDLFLRPTADLIGEGEIDFYSMGQHFEGVWRKESWDSPTRFYFLDGVEIERVYGQTWIHIMRQE